MASMAQLGQTPVTGAPSSDTYLRERRPYHREKDRTWMRAVALAVNAELSEQLFSLAQGEHACLVYEQDPSEQIPALVPFMKSGLEAGEQVIYVADDATTGEVARWLTASGVDVEAAEAAGSLLLWTRNEWRLPGPIDSAAKQLQVEEIIDRGLAGGFKGLRIGVEMTWTLGPDIEGPLLCHWEATLDRLLHQGRPVRVICQYSRRRLAPGVLRAGLATHPIAIIGTDVCPNPYYEAPLVLDGGGEEARLDWMISQLRRARAAERDREEKVRAEAALAEMQQSKRTIEELYERARATAEELLKANRVKDEFLALISHELRTPVTIILGSISILRARMTALDAATRDQALSDVHDEATRLEAIINDLLVLARYESGQDVQAEPIIIDRLVEQELEEFRRKTGRLNITLTANGHHTIVMAAESHLQTVLRNLLSNACKYSLPGSPVEVAVIPGAQEVGVVVRDRGVGITSDEAESLFAAFYRSPRVQSEVRGLGIGLTVCRRILEVQGGRVWAAPREGGGSEFGFALPPAEAPELAIVEAPSVLLPEAAAAR
jgi:signal transduction histidine kinase